MNDTNSGVMAHHVLVVDDDPGVRESMKELLQLEGYEVDTAEHGLEGLQRLLDTRPTCLVLLDLMMPVMNGLEFLQALRRHSDPELAATPVAVVSALDEAREVRDRFHCEVLRKPVDLDRLLQTVQRHCHCPC